MELDGLLSRIERLTPHFGRAQGDLQALVSRGRAGDFKGVLQNSRLVLEMLLRAIVTTELKQTPGKAMLDELITKFRQGANAGLVPTNVLAHMGTVQAWGNLSSHDHAGSLQDEGVRVGLEEAVTALNSMLAILTWHAAKYPAAGAPPLSSADPAAGPVAPSAMATPYAGSAAIAPAKEPPRRSRLPLVLAVGGLLAAAGVGGFLAFRPHGPSGQELAEVENVAGNDAVKQKDLPRAEAHYRKALELFPELHKARFNLGVLKLQQNKVDEALALLEAFVAKQDSDADGHFFLGMAHEATAGAARSKGDEARGNAQADLAKASYCRALDLGKPLAKDRCGR